MCGNMNRMTASFVFEHMSDSLTVFLLKKSFFCRRFSGLNGMWGKCLGTFSATLGTSDLLKMSLELSTLLADESAACFLRTWILLGRFLASLENPLGCDDVLIA